MEKGPPPLRTPAGAKPPSKPSATPSIGILGGGQLARMLCETASRLGLKPHVLAESIDSSAAQVCPRTIVGSLDNRTTLTQFFSSCDLVVFENEFVDTRVLSEVANQVRRAHFFPSLATLSRLQDKVGQKELLKTLAIPNAPFRVFPFNGQPRPWVEQVMRELKTRKCVLKWGRMGYDGKGVFVVDDLASQIQPALEFCARAIDRGLSLFAEAFVPFKRELAIIGCRSVAGEFLSYPLVLSEQQNGICLDVSGPATALGVDPQLAVEADTFARKIAEAAQIVGCFAVEFFETVDGKLWVNELAPRVHNSGHYTQDACATSQFENHLRAVLGLPLGEIDPRPAFVMGNLLGPEGLEIAASAVGDALPKPTSRLHLHWYGKTELRPGRKLGHLNAVASDPAEMGALHAEVRACRDRWAQSLTQSKGENTK